MIHYKIKPEDIGDRLHIDGEKSLLISTTTRQGTTIRTPVVDALVEAIEALEIDVLFVDPFISSHDAPESWKAYRSATAVPAIWLVSDLTISV